MKKLIVSILSALTLSACAGGHYTHNEMIVTGVIVGATVGYIASRPQQPAMAIMPVPSYPGYQFYPYGYVPPPGYQFRNCGPWGDYIMSNGVIVRGRYCY